jgi:hypothetical protein
MLNNPSGFLEHYNVSIVVFTDCMYLVNQGEANLIINEFDVAPVDLLFVILFLFQLEHMMIEMLLKFL